MKRLTLAALILSAFALEAACPNPPPFPSPKVIYKGATSDSGFIRYVFEVVNRGQYTDALFVASPALPACGLNTKASRTWLRIYDSQGKYLYGYCALTKNAEMAKLIFSVKTTAPQPQGFFITLEDRLCSKTVKSNVWLNL